MGTALNRDEAVVLRLEQFGHQLIAVSPLDLVAVLAAFSMPYIVFELSDQLSSRYE